MTACTFAEFYAACAPKLTDIQLRQLNTKAEFFKLSEGYCGLFIDGQGVWVDIFVGGIRDIWELRRIVAREPKIGFLCRVGSPTYALARYYKATIEDSGQKYLDGVPAMRCIVNTQQTQRLQKNLDKVKA